MPIKLVVSLCVLGLIAMYPCRLLYLRAKSRPLIQKSASFPSDYWVGNPNNPELTYVSLGDSTAAGTGSSTVDATLTSLIAHQHAARGNRVHVINFAQVGARYSDLISHQLPRLTDLQPDIITISIGANDATHLTNLDDFTQQLQKTRDTLRTFLPRATIYITTTPDLGLVPALPFPYNRMTSNQVEKQNQVFTQLFADTEFKVVDIFTKGKLNFQKDRDLYAQDKFHPSDKGYAVWASVFKDS